MELVGSTHLALLTSTDVKKRLLGLMQIRQEQSTGASGSTQTMLPLLVQRFVAPRTEKKLSGPAQLQRRIAYKILKNHPAYGPTWVAIANAIDRDLLLALHPVGEDSGSGTADLGNAEIGVEALRTILSLPYAHIEEYMRNRWDSIMEAATSSRNITLRVTAIDCVIAFATPPSGAENAEREALVTKVLARPRFSETLRRLLLDGNDAVCAKAFDLLSVIFTGNQLSTGIARPVMLLVSPAPQWAITKVGITDDVCKELLARVAQLPLVPQMNCVFVITSLCMSMKAEQSSLGLRVADQVILPALHCDWSNRALIQAAVSLLSIVVHVKTLLLSLFPHLTLCTDKLVMLVQKQAIPPDIASRYVFETLYSLLPLLPVEARVRHVHSLLDAAVVMHQAVASNAGGEGSGSAGVMANSSGTASSRMGTEGFLTMTQHLDVLACHTMLEILVKGCRIGAGAASSDGGSTTSPTSPSAPSDDFASSPTDNNIDNSSSGPRAKEPYSPTSAAAAAAASEKSAAAFAEEEAMARSLKNGVKPFVDYAAIICRDDPRSSVHAQTSAAAAGASGTAAAATASASIRLQQHGGESLLELFLSAVSAQMRRTAADVLASLESLSRVATLMASLDVSAAASPSELLESHGIEAAHVQVLVAQAYAGLYFLERSALLVVVPSIPVLPLSETIHDVLFRMLLVIERVSSDFALLSWLRDAELATHRRTGLSLHGKYENLVDVSSMCLTALECTLPMLRPCSSEIYRSLSVLAKLNALFCHVRPVSDLFYAILIPNLEVGLLESPLVVPLLKLEATMSHQHQAEGGAQEDAETAAHQHRVPTIPEEQRELFDLNECIEALTVMASGITVAPSSSSSSSSLSSSHHQRSQQHTQLLQLYNTVIDAWQGCLRSYTNYIDGRRRAAFEHAASLRQDQYYATTIRVLTATMRAWQAIQNQGSDSKECDFVVSQFVSVWFSRVKPYVPSSAFLVPPNALNETEATMATTRRLMGSRAVSANCDPVHATLHYAYVPGDGVIEVAAVITNKSEMCLAQVSFQFSSTRAMVPVDFVARSNSGGEGGGQRRINGMALSAEFPHAPKRSLFLTLSPGDNRPPSSAAHIIQHNATSYTIMSLPASGRVVLTCCFCVTISDVSIAPSHAALRSYGCDYSGAASWAYAPLCDEDALSAVAPSSSGSASGTVSHQQEQSQLPSIRACDASQNFTSLSFSGLVTISVPSTVGATATSITQENDLYLMTQNDDLLDEEEEDEDAEWDPDEDLATSPRQQRQPARIAMSLMPLTIELSHYFTGTGVSTRQLLRDYGKDAREIHRWLCLGESGAASGKDCGMGGAIVSLREDKRLMRCGVEGDVLEIVNHRDVFASFVAANSHNDTADQDAEKGEETNNNIKRQGRHRHYSDDLPFLTNSETLVQHINNNQQQGGSSSSSSINSKSAAAASASSMIFVSCVGLSYNCKSRTDLLTRQYDWVSIEITLEQSNSNTPTSSDNSNSKKRKKNLCTFAYLRSSSQFWLELLVRHPQLSPLMYQLDGVANNR